MMRAPGRRLVSQVRPTVQARALGQLSISDRLGDQRPSVDVAAALAATKAAGRPHWLPSPAAARAEDGGAGGARAASRLETDWDAVRALGRGGFGRVVAARHRVDGATYALKLQRRSCAAAAEARVMAAIGPHGHVVRYVTAWYEDAAATARFAAGLSPNDSEEASDSETEASEADDADDGPAPKRLVLQLDLCGGGDLRSWLDDPTRSRAPAALAAAARDVGGQIASALAHVHKMGYAHLDVAPRNVFFDGAETWRLGDFGLAARFDEVRGDGLDGAPERRLFGVPLRDARPADVFSLGVVVFELLHVFSTTMERALALEGLKAGRADLAAAETALKDLVDAALDRDPDARPSAAACRLALA